MNFLSKLIIIVIISLIAAVTLIFIELNDLKGIQAKLNSKIKIIDNRAISIPIDTTKQTPKEESFGIDVSHWNGDIVSELPLNDDISFIICKATQGKGVIDPYFQTNWITIKEMNKIRGAYHFYIYSDNPEVQANHFCEVVTDLDENDISLILDIEELSLPKTGVDRVKLKEDIIKFLEFVENKINRIPIIYTDYSFANKYLNDTKFSKYPLWLAEYSNSKTPKIPIAWKERGCLIWQKKSNYNINSTNVDYDIFFGKKGDIVQ